MMYYIDTSHYLSLQQARQYTRQIGTDIVHQAFFKTLWRDFDLNPKLYK